MHYDAATKGFIFHEHKWRLAVVLVHFSQKMLQQAISIPYNQTATEIPSWSINRDLNA